MSKSVHGLYICQTITCGNPINIFPSRTKERKYCDACLARRRVESVKRSKNRNVNLISYTGVFQG